MRIDLIYKTLVFSLLPRKGGGRNDLLNIDSCISDSEFYETLDASLLERVFLLLLSQNFISQNFILTDRVFSAASSTVACGLIPYYNTASFVRTSKKTLFPSFHSFQKSLSSYDNKIINFINNSNYQSFKN